MTSKPAGKQTKKRVTPSISVSHTGGKSLDAKSKNDIRHNHVKCSELPSKPSTVPHLEILIDMPQELVEEL